MSDALLKHVVPYFGTPHRLLSDQGQEFVGEIWGKLMRSLGVQRLLTSPYHPDGNSINKRSHRTINNMLQAHLIDGASSRAWVEKIPGIMLALNAMTHEPHGFSASMIATGREPTLPPDLQKDACASPSLDDPTAYVEMLRQCLSLTHQQLAPPPTPAATNPYQEGSLIFVLTTPSECTNKLATRWKGPFLVKRIPNPYQVVYEDGPAWRTIHVNNAKPAKLTAADLPAPTPTPEPSRPALGNLPKSLQRPHSPLPPPPLQPAASAGGASPPPTASIPAPSASSPPASQQPAREASSANRNSAPLPRLSSPSATETQPPASARTNENSGSGFRPRRSARLNPQAYAIKSPLEVPAPQSLHSDKMARTYPLSLEFNRCLGAKEDPYSFSGVYLEDLRNCDLEYLSTIKQLVDALPKTMDPASHFALHGHITPSGHKRLQHSMRAARWWLSPSDGEFRQAPHTLYYHLARQGRHVVLRGGDVTQPLYESRVYWIYNPAPPTPHRPAMESADTPASAILKESPGAPSTQPERQRSQRRRRRKAACTANHNAASRQANPMTSDECWANENSASRRATRPRSAANDRPEMRSTPVEHLHSFHSSRLSQPPIPATNENSGISSRLDHPEFSELYKPAQVDPRQDSTATHSRVNSSAFGLSSPTLQQPCTKPFSGLPSRCLMTSPYREAGDAVRERPGIIYPCCPAPLAQTRRSR